MTPTQELLVQQIAEKFGHKSVITCADDIAPWLRDWRGRYCGSSPAILLPQNTFEVAAIIEIANELKVPLVPQGGNTSMVGGATPPEDGSAFILSLRRMDNIRALSPEDNQVVAEAGVILANLHGSVAAIGRRFPLTLGARGSATVGGLVSTNAGGTQVLRFGTMRQLVVGVEAVLPDGSIHQGLSALKKDNRGYDLDQLFIGAEGTLGVVTAATLRLAPAVAKRSTAWAGLLDADRALHLLRTFEADSSAVESFEIVPGDSLSLVIKHLPGIRSPLSGNYPWHILIEAVSTQPEAESPADMMERVLAGALASGLIEDAVIAANERQSEALWKIRDSLSEAERASGPAAQHDVSVPVGLMPRFMVEAAREVEAAFPGTRASAFGHLGDGNVHFHVRAAADTDHARWYAEEAPQITRLVHDLVVAAGGSISAEHGIGQMKRAELERLGPPARLAALAAVKRALDPKGLLNPGKLVPLWTYEPSD